MEYMPGEEGHSKNTLDELKLHSTIRQKSNTMTETPMLTFMNERFNNARVKQSSPTELTPRMIVGCEA